MSCDHCLRGETEKLDMSMKFMCSLLNQVEHIGAVTFTGGEPSLAVDSIEAFLAYAKLQRVSTIQRYI